MRIHHYFCENDRVRDLISSFDTSQGSLFHYTKATSASGIRGGELWMTRADCFLDVKEIEFGLMVLEGAANVTLAGKPHCIFLQLLAAVRARLVACYVFSVSKAHNSNYLREHYASQSGVILKLPEDFASYLRLGMHQTPNGDGSYRCHRVGDHYDLMEGFVIYDSVRQEAVANLACSAFLDLQQPDTHVVDSLHFVNLLMKCMVLFKESTYAPEEEYRLVLAAKQGGTTTFERSREVDGKTRYYIPVLFRSNGISELDDPGNPSSNATSSIDT